MASADISNFLATDKVPDTIFGIPIVSREEDYTEEDAMFFRDHPEAGGYYDMGDEDNETPLDNTPPPDEKGVVPDEPVQPAGGDLPPAQMEGGVQAAVKGGSAGNIMAATNERGRDFSLLFERKPKTQTVNGRVYYVPEKDSAGNYDINGYRYWLDRSGKLRPHTNAGRISAELYADSVRATDRDIDSIVGGISRTFGLSDSLDSRVSTALRDAVFAGGGETIKRESPVTLPEGGVLKASPNFHGIVRSLRERGLGADDAFGVAMMLEQDTYGGTNYRRYAARGGLVADALGASEDPTAKRFADAYRSGWDSAELRGDGRSTEEDAFGTNYARHTAGMREARKVADELGLVYSGKGKK